MQIIDLPHTQIVDRGTARCVWERGGRFVVLVGEVPEEGTTAEDTARGWQGVGVSRDPFEEGISALQLGAMVVEIRVVKEYHLSLSYVSSST
jgi:hypothetical protein